MEDFRYLFVNEQILVINRRSFRLLQTIYDVLSLVPKPMREQYSLP